MYSVDLNGVIKRLADGYIVPKDVGDLAYQGYLYWLSSGMLPNTPQSPTPAQVAAAISLNDATT